MAKGMAPPRQVSGSVKDPFAINPSSRKLPGGMGGAIENRLTKPPVTPATPAVPGVSPAVPASPAKTMGAVRNIPPPVMSSTPVKSAIGRRMKKKPVIQ